MLKAQSLKLELTVEFAMPALAIRHVLKVRRYLDEKTVPCGTAVPVNPCGHDLCVMLTPARVAPESRNRSSTDNAPFAGSKLMM
jgi:hypothetical protein